MKIMMMKIWAYVLKVTKLSEHFKNRNGRPLKRTHRSCISNVLYGFFCKFFETQIFNLRI